MQVRTATTRDADNIRAIYLSAFPEGESALVAKLAIDLLSEESKPGTLSLLAEADGSVLGHVAFSPVSFESGGELKGYILAPLAVAPDYQRRGVGSQLVESGMEQVAANGAGVVFVYGDPRFYGKFGFSVDAARGYLPPYSLQHAFGWQAIFLRDCEGGASSGTLTCVPSLRDPALW